MQSAVGAPPARRPLFRASWRYRLKRALAGCFYLGCFAPLGYLALTAWIVIDWLLRRLRPPAP